MNNQFKPDELVKVSGKNYPVVGGRLRLAHEESKLLNIETTVITYDGEKAIIQAKITTDKGTFNGLGNATITRDAKLKSAILELAETRAIARALRFAGYGVEYTGFEEMPDEHPERAPQIKQDLPKGNATDTSSAVCIECKKPISEAENDYSISKFKKCLCRTCQAKHKAS